MRQESISDIFSDSSLGRLPIPIVDVRVEIHLQFHFWMGSLLFFFFLVSRVFGYIYCFQYSPWCLKSSAEVPVGVPLGEGEWGPQWGWTTGVQIKEKLFHFSICIEFLVKFYVREVFYNWEKNFEITKLYLIIWIIVFIPLNHFIDQSDLRLSTVIISQLFKLLISRSKSVEQHF